MQITDQMGNRLELEHRPFRIISLVPSQTELLSYLGLDEEVIGITKFCVHPDEWYRNKTRIGGTKKVHIDKVKALKPDLIIANKEENTAEEVKQLRQICPVFVSEITTLEDALDMIHQIGLLTERQEKADTLVDDIKAQLRSAGSEIKDQLNVAYFIWKDPLMVVGHSTYIHHFMAAMGFKNAFGHLQRYPKITIDQLKSLDLDHIFLSSEPFPFKEKHKSIFTDVLPTKNVHIVDGEAFSWYGNRMLHGIQYAKNLYRSLHDPI